MAGDDLIVADLDLAAQRIRSLPELAGEFLADDDGGRLAVLVFLPEGAADRQRDAGGIEVVLPHHVADHRAGLVRRVAGRGNPDAAAPMETGTVSVRLAEVTEGSSFTRSSSFCRNAVACAAE